MMQKHRRGPWSQAEDQHLIHLVHSQGAHNWVRISQLIGSRSPKQCRERYHQNLKPSLNLDPITPEEGVLIERMVAEMGKRWAEIARRLNGRSDNAVKNWWNGGVNRRKRLETRRADAAAAARQPHVTVYCPPSATGMYNSAQQPLPMYNTQMMPGYPGQAQSYNVEPRSLPYPTAPTPINTLQASNHAHRRLGEGPLPSPSALSTMSRSESVSGAAPSLVSDGGSYTSYSQSPNRSPNSNALPPLASIAGEQRLSGAQQYVQPNGQVYQLDDSAYRTPYKAGGYPPYQTPYATPSQEWSEQHVIQPVVPSQGQLSIPSFRNSSGAETRSNGPPSPPRDSRMNLSNVMS